MQGEGIKTLYKEKIAVKIGQKGISKGRIAADAEKRAKHALKVFKTVIDQFNVDQVKGVATSAIRNASNGEALLNSIKAETGITIEVISGDQEAELIYYGVKASNQLTDHNQLIMDIGGGSVEFIIGDSDHIHWKKSFEIGAQRLLDKFHKSDPIGANAIQEMNDSLTSELKELIDAIDRYSPVGLIGCSGTFDTIKEIHCYKESSKEATNPIHFKIPKSSYRRIHNEFIHKNREQRLAIPGMVTMRVDMIVVASCLIDFVLNHVKTEDIIACSYALKEGVLFFDHQNLSLTNI